MDVRSLYCTLYFPLEIDSLHQCRRQLCDKFRTEQLAYLAASSEQIEEEKQRRDQTRAAREEQKRMRWVVVGAGRER